MRSELDAVLARYPSVARPWGTPEPLGNAGGMSGSRLWRYHAGLGTLLLRAWPHDGPPRTALEQIHGWLGEIGPLGFVPVPVRALDGRTLQERGGRFWEVTPWMPGSTDEGKLSSPRHVAAGFSALAAFHRGLAHHRSGGTSPGLLARQRELEWLTGGGLSRIANVLERHEADPVTGMARRWVELAKVQGPPFLDTLKRAAGVEVERQPCLRDVRPEHFLFDGDRVTGLVDFGAMGVESVAADLARLLSEWPGPDQALRSVGFDAYEAIRPVGPVESALIGVFERSASLLGPGHWVRWHFLDGRKFEDPQAVARGLERGLRRLEPRFQG